MHPCACVAPVRAAGRGKPLPYGMAGSVFAYVGAGLALPAPGAEAGAS